MFVIMALIYILEFIIFSFIGWVLDSGYRSLTERKWINAGYFKGPICPIYGVGGLTLSFLFKYFNFLHLSLVLLIASLFLILIEYFGGIFSEKILKIKLWDYSDTTLNLGGHIDAIHSFFWVILTILFYYFIFPIIILFEKIIYFPEYLNLPSLIIFSLLVVWAIVRKNPEQFLEFKGKVMDMSVSDYQTLFTNIKKWSKVQSSTKKKVLMDKITSQLKDTNAKLKNIKKSMEPKNNF